MFKINNRQYFKLTEYVKLKAALAFVNFVFLDWFIIFFLYYV